VGLHRPVCRLAGCVRCHVLGDVRLLAARLAVIEQPSCLVHHEFGRFQLGERVRQGKLNALVHADRAVEDYPLLGVLHRFLHRALAHADTLGGDEDTLGIDAIDNVVEAPAFLSDDLDAAREQVRWFPALVSNHVVDLLKRYDVKDLPKALTDYIKARDHYDYSEHAQRGAAHADFVPDDVIDRFCVIGTVEQSRRRIEELIEVGVDQFNLYLMVEKPEAVIKKYGEAIIPAFS